MNKSCSELQTSADRRMKENNVPVLNWRRIEKSLRQYARRRNCEDECPGLLSTLKTIVDLCGSYTASRKKLLAIGKALLNPNRRLICTVCLGSRDLERCREVPHVVLDHERFLLEILKVIGPTPVLILIPVHDNPSHREEAHQVVETVSTYVERRGWAVSAMGNTFPEILERERYWLGVLQSGEDSEKCVRSFAKVRVRTGLYRFRNMEVTEEEAVNLTRQTSAQYLALGEFTNKQTWFVCNHTTLNLKWYGVTRSALLHNPVFLGI